MKKQTNFYSNVIKYKKYKKYKEMRIHMKKLNI